MKPALILLIGGFCALLPAWAAPCIEVQLQLASVRTALVHEDTSKADEILDKLEQSGSGCNDIYLYRAQSLYLEGRTTPAADAIMRFIRLAPNDARGYAQLGRLFLDEQEYARADAASALALQKNSSDPSALALRGEILSMKGNLDEGIRLLEEASRMDPDNSEISFQLGTLYDQAKRNGEAVRQFEKSLSLVPRNAQAWDYLALNLEPLGQFERAEDAYRKAEVANGPGRHFDGFLEYNYGRFLAKDNRLKEAKEHLDRAVEIAPQVRAVWYERAKVQVALKQYQDARSDAEKAASLPDPSHVILDLQTYALLEQIYRRLGENDLAKKYADLSRITAVPVSQDGR